MTKIDDKSTFSNWLELHDPVRALFTNHVHIQQTSHKYFLLQLLTPANHREAAALKTAARNEEKCVQIAEMRRGLAASQSQESSRATIESA